MDIDIKMLMTDIGKRARMAERFLVQSDTETKNKALKAAALVIRDNSKDIKIANSADMEAGKIKGLSKAMLDRLMLDDKRIEAMASGLEDIAELPDPVGRILSEWTRPNGLIIKRVSVPLGVIGIIYESRPNVTADAAGLCLKSGNTAILRGGSESFNSSMAIMGCLRRGIADSNLPADSVQIVPVTDRDAVGIMLKMTEYIDVIVPRGGKSLISRIVEESRIPLFQHLEGICHTYIHCDADLEMACNVVLNAKLRRTGICGATETLLVDNAAVKSHLSVIIKTLLKAGCEVRGDSISQLVDNRVLPATEEDWHTEYLDAIISVKVVDGVAGAVEHINRYGSRHTESIITETESVADIFLKNCDSAIILWNASTQFADGGEFGMGAEIGISTGRLHARGPIGVEQLCTFKYQILGCGQIRPV